ncbi:hypothetical protein C8F04DRAFT_1232751 [Mycena alexandri]|uniref:Uncharacterized protein n=1 Tax=Mycena alexandri TaxID=1745969 RepID=A0AAD6X9G4_9AGAR|nr:hypothetical protein C8F04DRAFT_1232751 [Mycena alexandri]
MNLSIAGYGVSFGSSSPTSSPSSTLLYGLLFTPTLLAILWIIASGTIFYCNKLRTPDYAIQERGLKEWQKAGPEQGNCGRMQGVGLPDVCFSPPGFVLHAPSRTKATFPVTLMLVHQATAPALDVAGSHRRRYPPERGMLARAPMSTAGTRTAPTYCPGARVGVHAIRVHKDARGRMHADAPSWHIQRGRVRWRDRADVLRRRSRKRTRHPRVNAYTIYGWPNTYRASVRADVDDVVACALYTSEMPSCAPRAASVCAAARRVGSVDRIRHKRAASRTSGHRLGWSARPDVVWHARPEQRYMEIFVYFSRSSLQTTSSAVDRRVLNPDDACPLITRQATDEP